jgi:TonB family protein
VVPFETLPPPVTRVPAGAIASLIVHGLVIAAYLLPSQPDDDQGPVEQQVVFLVPPDDKLGQPAAEGGTDWNGIVGSGGATKERLRKEDKPPEIVLPVGPEGEPEPDDLKPGPPIRTETALTEIEVDSVVERDPNSQAPVYPPLLLERNVEGSTFVHYVVDTTGRVDTVTIEVIRTSHPQFAVAVREALALMRFRPAIQSSRKVRQWVEQNFAFRIVRPVKAVADTT